jgi:hypothetical protein
MQSLSKIASGRFRLAIGGRSIAQLGASLGASGCPRLCGTSGTSFFPNDRDQHSWKLCFNSLAMISYTFARMVMLVGRSKPSCAVSAVLTKPMRPKVA